MLTLMISLGERGPKAVDSEALLKVIETNLENSNWRVSGEQSKNY